MSYMRRDSRLSGVLHVLLHMADARKPVTSASLARAMNTNPVVIRRIMSGLRELGYVQSEKGHGGGWSLVCDPFTVTLRDIHAAIGSPRLLAIGHRSDHPDCVVEQTVNSALSDVFDEAEALLLARFAEVTLADLREDIRLRLQPGSDSHTLEHAHVI